MKRLIAFVPALLVALAVSAVPARKGAFTVRQPDGTTLRLERHGDEFFSWTTLAGSSQVMERAADGFWRASSIDPAARKAGERRRAQANALRPRTHDTSNTLTHGERRIPVLLLEFTDVKFSVSNPADKFTALLNQHGYSAGGGTGSVQDYYLDNSDGQFKPVFDVYGPVTLPHDMKYYGEPVRDSNDKITSNDIHAELALYDGCKLLDSIIDFSRYDYDNDGKVDMTLFYYAGFNTAEGGSDDAIWPHQWYLSASSDANARNARFDGKKVDRYFCTSELQGNSGTTMCAIGTTCHEFGHSLGLPDFYDTDENNVNCEGLYDFSVMCGGSYNNESRTPPWFNAEERIILGWMTESDIVEIKAGEVRMVPVRNSIAYRSQTGIEGEYFLYECRDGYGWDAPLPRGMVVYHVDKSKSRRVGNRSPYDLWNYTNLINAYGEHPCFYVVPAADQDNLNYKGNMASCLFPGSNNVRFFSPQDWNGQNLTGIVLSGITYADGTVQMNASFSQEKQLVGRVTDLTGVPLPGVYVKLSAPVSPSAAPRALRSGAPRSIEYEALSDDSGDFHLSLEGFDYATGHLTLSKTGYRTAGFDVTLEERINHVTLNLSRKDQGDVNLFYYYEPGGSIYYYGDGTNNSLMAAICIPAWELPSGGGTLSYVRFTPIWDADSYYIIVDEGSKRILTHACHPASFGSMQQVNVEVTVSGEEDLYVGYAVENARPTSGYDGYLFEITKEPDGHCHLSSFDLSQSYWGSGHYSLVLDACIIEKADNPDDPDPGTESFAAMGIPCIADPQGGVYAPGSNLSLELELPEGLTPSSVKWEFDGRDVTGAKSVSLLAGKHLLVARVKWADGSLETLSLQLDVK